ncbi:hypothetical protein EW146_g3498 [Bondarzewia mesenterica]|uniref:DUF159-domain-containing protein n=1 Tax=Bondarzewia mesenterica TaxID=1095465 RepID=A0A4S4LXD7_9AGAM|nr:hypothetical protein EW146_g3498 [Bondarzewia mesenterica]
MCGRYSLGLPADEVEQLPGHPALQQQVGEWIDRDNFVPRYNVAPRTQAPVLRRANASSDQGPQLVLHTMKWGLVPHWSKSESISLKTINARAENLVGGSGMWKSIRGKKRCVILAQGYYEWLKRRKDRFPHFTRHKDGRLMLLAGLYDTAYIEGQSKPLWTFTIVTTAANKHLEWLHDRQPVVLASQTDVDIWLDTSSQTWNTNLNKLLEPYDDSIAPLQCYPVPKEVGKVGTESPAFIEPISQRNDGIKALFSKEKRLDTTSTVSAYHLSESDSPSSSKRKRMSSTEPELDHNGPASQDAYRQESEQPKRERHAANVDLDSDIEIIDVPSESDPQLSSGKVKPVVEEPESGSPASSSTSQVGSTYLRSVSP